MLGPNNSQRSTHKIDQRIDGYRRELAGMTSATEAQMRLTQGRIQGLEEAQAIIAETERSDD